MPATPAGELLFSTRTVDPLAAAAEARRTGLWTHATVTDALWPPETPRPRPLLPLRRGHLAMLVAAGFLDNLCLEANGQRLLVKGRTAKELVLVERTREQEVRRERLRTTVVALDLAHRHHHRHRRLAPLPTPAPHTGPPPTRPRPVPARDRRGRVCFSAPAPPPS